MLNIDITELKKQSEYGKGLLQEIEKIDENNVDNLEITRRIENYIIYASKAGQSFVDVDFTDISEDNTNGYITYFQKKGFSVTSITKKATKTTRGSNYIRISW